MGTPGPKARPVAVRFWERVERGADDECWHWTGKRNKAGYGIFRIFSMGETTACGAHRMALQLTGGAIPDGLNVLHRCDNPPCCNPRHLFVGDQAANMDDAKAKGRLVRGPQPKADVCRRGHVVTDANSYWWRSVRHCRECRNTNEENRRGVPRRPKAPSRTTCRKGHPLTEENAYYYNGTRYCRPCRSIQEEARQSRRHLGNRTKTLLAGDI